MNSRDKPTLEGPLYKKDPETGRITLLPLNRKWASPNSKVKSSEKKDKRIIKLAPLRLTAADFEEPPDRANKMRKTNSNSVRKELFNLPPKDSRMSRSSINARKSLRSRNIPTQKMPTLNEIESNCMARPKRFKPSELSPLIDMEEMEEELIKNKGVFRGYPFKTPNKPTLKFTENSNRKEFIKSKDPQNIPNIVVNDFTPSSQSINDSEFLELEKYCGATATKESEYETSPISSVCNIFNKTVIDSSRKGKTGLFNNDRITQQTLERVQNLLTEYNDAFDTYNTSHEKNINKITELLETDRKQYENLVALKNKNTNALNDVINELKKITSANGASETEANKENTPIRSRRSLRLLNRSPVQASGAKMIVSPVVLKSKDLRKSTLTKNLVTKSKQYNIESPRIQKALNMYNSMRCEISILATPKLDRNSLCESPRSANLSRNLSKRVQNQCLLLQDTPIHL